MKEAAKLGFEQAMVPCPPKREKSKSKKPANLPLHTRYIEHLDDVVTMFSAHKRAA
jgi:predicted ATP-dependent serine protease